MLWFTASAPSRVRRKNGFKNAQVLLTKWDLEHSNTFTLALMNNNYVEPRRCSRAERYHHILINVESSDTEIATE